MPEVIDLAKNVDKIAGPEDPKKWDIQDINQFWADDIPLPAN